MNTAWYTRHTRLMCVLRSQHTCWTWYLLPWWLRVAAALLASYQANVRAQVVVHQVVAQPAQIFGGAQPGGPNQPQALQPGQPAAGFAPSWPAVYTIEGERIPCRPLSLEDGQLLLPTDPVRRISLHDIDRVEFGGLAELKAQWLGQDGGDYVQAGAAPGPNGVPDIHIRLSGLAFDTPVKQVVLACHNPMQRSVWRLDPSRTPNWKLHLERVVGTDLGDVYVEPDSHDAFGHDFTLTVLYQDNRTARARLQATTHTSNTAAAGAQPQPSTPPTEQPPSGPPTETKPPPAPEPPAGQPAPQQPGADQPAVNEARASQPLESQPGATQLGGQPTTQPDHAQAGAVMVHGQGLLKLRGQLAQMTDTTLTLVASWGGELHIPLAEVRALQWLGNNTPDAQQKFEAAMANPAVEDTLLVRGRDQAVSLVQGTATGFVDGRLQFDYEGRSGNIVQARLVGLVFARQPARAPVREPFQVVELATGERLAGAWTGLTAESLELTTSWGERALLPASVIAQVQFRNGRLVYLSDLEPVEVEEVGYFGRTFSHRRDQAQDGGPLRLGGQAYRKGVSVHARTVLTYELDGPFATFRTLLGFADSAAPQGRVAIRILGDGRELFSQADFRAVDAEGKRTAPLTVEVPLDAIKRLTLEVDFGKHEDVGDRLIWADARLYRAVADGQAAAVK